MLRRHYFFLLIAVPALSLLPDYAYSYIGPGAGFAFAGSFFLMLTAIIAAAAMLLLWPVRMAIYRLRRGKGYKKTATGRVVVIGLDGIDPDVTKKLMDEGRLPHFKGVMEEGTFMPLQTTCPSISPVAWSSFSTGLSPAKHGIFDFLDRDLKTYLPVLSSARIGKPKKFFALGKYRVPLGKAPVKLLRKGKPFWSFLGEKGISCSVLRVPITFPPEEFDGRILSAMCTPDLRGSQGTFSYYTDDEAEAEGREGGQIIRVKADSGLIRTRLVGPGNPFVKGEPECSVPFTVKPDIEKRTACLSLQGASFTLREGEYSDWVTVGFPFAPGIKAKGICRFLVTSVNPFRLYVTPINIAPQDPALPVSHPKSYSVYLGKLLGNYATLGLAEDTWALNEKVIDEAQFLEQSYAIHSERERMLFNEIENVRKGLVVCVFDITDRVQHMFWRYLDDGHPALAKTRTGDFGGAVHEVYEKMDGMVGRVKEKLGPDDVLLVISDHGFGSFRRGVNLNSWLHENGYLTLKEGKEPSGEEWFRSVDWTKTKAYAVGLGGVCLNMKGRESKGVVTAKEAAGLKAEIIAKLGGLKDADGTPAVKEVYDLKKLYAGPYLENGPELVVGFNKGYRVSWECAKGAVDGIVFKDNAKAWSGDHCTDFSTVPGVLLTNKKVKAEKAHIMDIAPTIIKAFGVDIPGRMEGRPLF